MKIKYGTQIIIYGTDDISAEQIARCYGLNGYNYKTLVNIGEEKQKLRYKDLSKCIELYIQDTYPKIEFTL